MAAGEHDGVGKDVGQFLTQLLPVDLFGFLLLFPEEELVEFGRFMKLAFKKKERKASALLIPKIPHSSFNFGLYIFNFFF